MFSLQSIDTKLYVADMVQAPAPEEDDNDIGGDK
jgi:hypothetical protein